MYRPTSWMPPSGRRFFVSYLDTVPIFQLAIQAKLICTSWLLRVMRPWGSTLTPSPPVPTLPPSRLKPPSGGKLMVPLKPPSTWGGQTTMAQTSIGGPESGRACPPSGSSPVPPSGWVTTTRNLETSPLQVQPETAVMAAATIRKGNARRVIEAVSTRGGTGCPGVQAPQPAGLRRNHRWAPSVGQHSSVLQDVAI